MEDFSFLIGEDSTRRPCLVDISYQTDPPAEQVHPRITYQGNEPFVYFNKNTISLSDFLKQCANGEIRTLGHIAAYRANGRQTTISFNQRFRIKISERLQAVIESLRNAAPPQQTENKGAEAISVDTDENAPQAKDPAILDKDWNSNAITPEDDERRREKQAENGRLGEVLAMQFEEQRLRDNNCPNPEDCVKHIAKINSNAGFDIKSDWNGETRFIEVKASENGSKGFFISENEVTQLTRFASDGWLYFVNLAERDTPAFGVMALRDPGSKFEKQTDSTSIQDSDGNIGIKIVLTPTQYRARLIG